MMLLMFVAAVDDDSMDTQPIDWATNGSLNDAGQDWYERVHRYCWDF